jgi:hypothetical protein
MLFYGGLVPAAGATTAEGRFFDWLLKREPDVKRCEGMIAILLIPGGVSPPSP